MAIYNTLKIKKMRKERNFFVYIMTNFENTVLYTGVTNSLFRRVLEHKEKKVSGFSAKYNLNKLVYYEEFSYILNAINREKQIKSGSRKKKEELIKSINSEWNDLSDGMYE
jgi:putative endonuclease